MINELLDDDLILTGIEATEQEIVQVDLSPLKRIELINSILSNDYHNHSGYDSVDDNVHALLHNMCNNENLKFFEGIFSLSKTGLSENLINKLTKLAIANLKGEK